MMGGLQPRFGRYRKKRDLLCRESNPDSPIFQSVGSLQHRLSHLVSFSVFTNYMILWLLLTVAEDERYVVLTDPEDGDTMLFRNISNHLALGME